MQIQMDGGLRFDWDVHNTDHLAQHDVHPEEVEQALSGDVLTSTIVLPKTVKSAGRPWTNGVGSLSLKFTAVSFREPNLSKGAK